MYKLIITQLDNHKIIALSKDDKIIEINRIRAKDEIHIGDIYIGRVKSLLKNINAAFIQIAPDRICYLPLDKINQFLFVQQSHIGKVTPDDEIVVQIAKEATKTKSPVVKGDFNLSKQYAVLIHGSTDISFSHKIKDMDWIAQTKESLQDWMDKPYGFIIRTNAVNLSTDSLIQELYKLENEWKDICHKASFRPCYTVLLQETSEYLDLLQSLPESQNCLPEVVTDLPEVYEHLAHQSNIRLRFYEDSLLPLRKLYSLETIIERALHSRVWLKSGGSLIIEPTEALTVIDVNTGKNIASKTDKQKTFLKTNLEAAKEIAYQLRIRNISGIIIVDFIDLKHAEDRKQLMDYLAGCLQKDRVKTVLVDMTKLNLIEITRKRTRKPLHELFQIKEGKIKSN